MLLSIVASWSAACRAMDLDVFADPAVVAAVGEHAVPVRVDADRRPDIAERYGLGGWPSTLWLTPDGDILSGATYLDAPALASAVADIDARFQRDRDALLREAIALRAQRRAAPEMSPSRPRPYAFIRDLLLHEFDPEFAGFGRGAKFPLAAPLLFALHAGVATHDAALITIVETTLDRMMTSALTDPHDGAFHRACANRDWTEPDRARLLDIHADLIQLYLDAWRLLRHDRYRTRALAALRYVDDTLRDRARGGWWYSEPSDDVILADANARMMRTLVHAATALDDPRWLTIAVAAAERILPAAYKPNAGVAHCLIPADEGDRPMVFGLLTDAILMAAALLDLGDAAGQPVYVELAEELTRSCLRRLWDTTAAGAGFIDRVRTSAGAGDVGLLGEPLKPFSPNVQAARLLARLAERTKSSDLAARADETFAWLATVYDRQGILSSEYGLVLMELGMIDIDK